MRSGFELSPSQKEQARHGERIFPLKRYITILSDLYPAVAAHWHEEAELTIISEGTCTYQIHLETYHVQAGDILFIPPAELHSITHTPGTRMTSVTYVFHMDFLNTNSGDICSVKYLTPISRHRLVLPYIIRPNHPAYEKVRSILNNMEETGSKQDPGFEITMKAHLLYALSVLIPFRQSENARPQLEDEHTEKLKFILEYISEHYSEELTIPQLARLCFFSEYHFMRFFKKYTGFSCLEYIKNLRLEKAAAQLTQGGRSVLEISLSCGFSNLSYFYREFKKKYGMTPRQFVQNAPELHFLS